jgi:hypothetical protein
VGLPPHTRLLTMAARRTLRPLGLCQRGRSRLWLDDQGWWLVVVEFQPSSWSKGSYLNVGAMWLWYEKDYFSFDDGHRVEDFAPFEDEAQFFPIAEGLARRAAQEVMRYRALYPSVHAAAQHLAAKHPKSFWGLPRCGGMWSFWQCGRCRGFFAEIAGTDDRRDWAQAAASLADAYASTLEDLITFRRRFKEVVSRARRLLRLEELADIKLGEEG